MVAVERNAESNFFEDLLNVSSYGRGDGPSRVRVRPSRFEIEQLAAKAIIINRRSKSLSFWLDIQDISLTGMKALTEKATDFQFASGDRFRASIDLGGKIFDRYIHIDCELVWANKDGRKTCLGFRFIEIDQRYQQVFVDGLMRLGDPYSFEDLKSSYRLNQKV